MTDHIENENDDLDEEDPRLQLLESLADGLATLSEASDTPNGVSPVSSMFSSVDVEFASDAWMNQLAEIQGWLNLSDDLPLTGGKPFLQALIAELELDLTDLLAPGTASSSTPRPYAPHARPQVPTFAWPTQNLRAARHDHAPLSQASSAGRSSPAPPADRL